MCGIYMIKNKINGKVYIGQTKDISQRWSSHKCELNSNRHVNRHLQASWNKYGASAFDFIVIEYCDQNQLNEKEKHFIAQYDSYQNGYNLDQGGDGVVGFKHTPEQISKMRRIQNPLVVLQFDLNFHLITRFEGGATHVKKTLGYTKECILNRCKHKKSSSLTYKDSYWVYEQEYLSKNFSWDKYLAYESCCGIARDKTVKNAKRICQYTKDRELVRIFNSFPDVESAGFTRHQVNTI